MTRAEILALPVGRELDALVAEKVLGFQRGGLGGNDPDYWWCNPGYLNSTPHSLRVTRTPQFSTDIAAAWQVFQHHCLTSQMIGFNVYSPKDRPDLTEIDPLGYAREWMCTCFGVPIMAPTAPLAIVRAALLATLNPD